MPMMHTDASLPLPRPSWNAGTGAVFCLQTTLELEKASCVPLGTATHTEVTLVELFYHLTLGGAKGAIHTRRASATLGLYPRKVFIISLYTLVPPNYPVSSGFPK